MADARWVEVSLTVRPELAESVAEVLSRYIPQGVALEQKTIQNQTEENILEPAVRVFAYLLADDALESRKLQIEEALWHLGQIQPLPPATYTPIPDEDWMFSWKEHFQPFKVGKRLVIIPAWMHKKVTRRNQVFLRIQPGMAFGTGTHPSTRLCLELLEDCIHGGENVIDLGCGTGILAIAALRLGASHALALDNDPAAVQSAEEHALLNRVQDKMTISLGSLKEIQQGLFDYSEELNKTNSPSTSSPCHPERPTGENEFVLPSDRALHEQSEGILGAGVASCHPGVKGHEGRLGGEWSSDNLRSVGHTSLSDTSSGRQSNLSLPHRSLRGASRRSNLLFNQSDLVIVNILSSVILEFIQQGLADLVRPGGRLILSGLLNSQAPEIITTAQSKGLALTQKRSSQDWVALLLTNHK